MFIYLFCYGSNSIKQLNERLNEPINEHLNEHLNERLNERINETNQKLSLVPLVAEKAYLKNHVRIFSGYSKRWNGAVSSVFPCNNKKVYGIVVKLTLEQLEKLNIFEKGYHLEIKDIIIYEKNIIQTSVKSFIYIKDNTKFRKFPSNSYMNAINIMLNDVSNKNTRKIFIRVVKNNKIKTIALWYSNNENGYFFIK